MSTKTYIEGIYLTDASVRKMKATEERYFVRDSAVPGFGIRVAPSGRKTFELLYNFKKERRRLSLGEFGSTADQLSAAQARDLAVSARLLLRQGLDPSYVQAEQAKIEETKRKKELDRIEAEKKAQEDAIKADANRQRHTLRALLEAYVRHLEKQGKLKSSKNAMSAFVCHVFTDEEVSNIPAREVTARQIAAVMRRIVVSGKERTAGIVRAYIHAAYNLAIQAPHDAHAPADMIEFNLETNPVATTKTIPVVRGQRNLSSDELVKYMRHLTDSQVDAALRCALLSGGQRMKQLLRAKINDFDARAETLLLLDHKGRRTEPRRHLIPLAPKGTALVVSLVERAKHLKTQWLFSTEGAVPIGETTVSHRIAKISDDIGGEPFNLRDLRRTVETMLAGAGVSKDVLAQLLSHGLGGVQNAHYNRYDYITEKRATLILWEKLLTSILEASSDQ